VLQKSFCTAAWISRADQDGSLVAFLHADMPLPERVAV